MKIRLFTLVFIAHSLGLLAQNKATFTIQADKPTAEISPNMWGLFFEDINMGADGGIYAELVKNRSFEFFKPMMGWKTMGGKTMFGISIGGEMTVINRPEKEATNPRYLQVLLENNAKGSLGLTNEGFRGMGIKKGLRYDFSVFLPSKNG